MSKGEIAFAVFKSNPLRMGEIIEISRGGLSFSYIDNETDLADFSEMDILFVDEDFHLTQLPIKPVEDTVIVDSNRIRTLQMKRQTVKFKNLSKRQKKKLEYVLKNFTTGVVPKEAANKCGAADKADQYANPRPNHVGKTAVTTQNNISIARAQLLG